MPLSPDPSLREYTSFLASCLRKLSRIDLPSGFESLFMSHAKRLGTGEYEDLGSLVLIECHEQTRRGEQVTERDLKRIIDRIRHRISRRARRELPMDVDERLPDKSSVSWERMESAVRGFIDQLDPVDMLVFDARFLQGKRAADIAADLGIPQASLYRRLISIREAFEAYVRDLL